VADFSFQTGPDLFVAQDAEVMDLRSHGYAAFAGGRLDYREGLGEFNEKVLPLMSEAGLREPVGNSSAAEEAAGSVILAKTSPR
jgi:hypothetical protein